MIKDDSLDDVINAVKVLQSIGARICHPELNDYYPTIELCDGIIDHRILLDEDVNQTMMFPSSDIPEFESHHGSKFGFYATNIVGTVTVIMFVALIAGLFIGLLTLDVLDLQIIVRSSRDDDERMHAAGLIPIVERRHLLLVTLLILDVLASETLPLFLDKLVPPWVAVLLSTTLILLVGEIIPSAIFTGPNQLKLGYQMVPLVRLFLFIMYPVASPCANLLDYLVHPEEDTEEEYNRQELAALVQIQYELRSKEKKKQWKSSVRKMRTMQSAIDQTSMQYAHRNQSWSAFKESLIEAVNERQDNDEQEDPIEHSVPTMDKQEVDVVVGAMQMKTKVAMDVFTPLRQIYALPDDMVLDRDCITEIYAEGYSRVPVYHRTKNVDPDSDTETDRSRLCGFILTRQLMLIDWEHEREVRTMPIQIPDAISPRLNLVEALKILKTGGFHMAFVCARPDLANRALKAEKHIPVEAGLLGIITLDDIMESILQDRIYDERDIRDREQAVGTLTRWAVQKLQKFARKKRAERRGSNGSTSSHGTITSNSRHQGTYSSATDQTPLLTESGGRYDRSYDSDHVDKMV